jgi:hypothetical protein
MTPVSLSSALKYESKEPYMEIADFSLVSPGKN